jgi:hypothetical protein
MSLDRLLREALVATDLRAEGSSEAEEGEEGEWEDEIDLES